MSDSCMTGISHGPAFNEARRKMEAVQPGNLVRTVFSADDVAELIGLQGASFILKLPESAGNPCSYFGLQWFKDGKPLHPVRHEPEYIESYKPKTKSWLIDLGVRTDSFAENPTHRAVCCLRFVSLDGFNEEVNHQIKIQHPEGTKLSRDVRFYLQGSFGQKVDVTSDIPLACWYQFAPEIDFASDLLAVAHSSPLALMVYANFHGK